MKQFINLSSLYVTGLENLILFLVEKGANLNATNRKHDTALTLALDYGNFALNAKIRHKLWLFGRFILKMGKFFRRTCQDCGESHSKRS